ncbi:MAG: hypothetical protein JSS56_01660 [Proteobacteria bacterium]|nr:hypothetical protein [Pseudomonadota bacterium]
MAIDPIQVLQAAQRPPVRVPANGARPETTLLIAGATGVLGNELLRRLAGSHRYAQARVLAREPMQDGLRGVQSVLMPPDDADPRSWPRVQADVALVSFDPPRLYHDRERALWAPRPQQLPQIAAWLHDCGVRTLAVVQPHAQGRLPEALKRGLAGMDEQAVAALGFERLILVRSAQKPAQGVRGSLPQRVAEWMLSIARFMVPASEQPVRAAVVAQFVDAALRHAPPGTHVAAPELVWRAAQGNAEATEATVRAWLQGAP